MEDQGTGGLTGGGVKGMVGADVGAGSIGSGDKDGNGVGGALVGANVLDETGDGTIRFWSSTCSSSSCQTIEVCSSS